MNELESQDEGGCFWYNIPNYFLAHIDLLRVCDFDFTEGPTQV
jgi:hypothetical protein